MYRHLGDRVRPEAVTETHGSMRRRTRSLRPSTHAWRTPGNARAWTPDGLAARQDCPRNLDKTPTTPSLRSRSKMCIRSYKCERADSPGGDRDHSTHNLDVARAWVTPGLQILQNSWPKRPVSTPLRTMARSAMRREVVPRPVGGHPISLACNVSTAGRWRARDDDGEHGGR